MTLPLSTRADALIELMDDPQCDPQRLAATYRRFAVVNRLISGWGAVYRRILGPRLAALERPARVLDLGCGGGDLVVRLAELAARDGLHAEWIGVDPDARALEASRGRAYRGVEFRQATSSELLASGERFDVVLSNHVIHHLSADDLTGFAADSRALASDVVLHGDIARSHRAYALYTVGITPIAPGTFLRTDGLRSIRRSYRLPELAAALGGDWRIDTPAPFRLLAVAKGTA